jgi:hypothetical protein
MQRLYMMLLLPWLFLVGCGSNNPECLDDSNCSEMFFCSVGRCIPSAKLLNEKDENSNKEANFSGEVGQNEILVCHSDEPQAGLLHNFSSGTAYHLSYFKSEKGFCIKAKKKKNGKFVYYVRPRSNRPDLIKDGNKKCEVEYEPRYKGYPICM